LTEFTNDAFSMKIMKIPSTKNQNSKFKTDAMVVKHLLSDRNDPVIGISNLNIACPVK